MNILSLRQHIAEIANLYSLAGISLPLFAGLPSGIGASTLLSPEIAASEIDAALLRPIQTSLPPLPDDWTQVVDTSDITAITNGITVLNQFQQAGNLSNNALLQHVYITTLSLLMLNITGLQYDSVEQSQALRQTLHTHITMLESIILHQDGLVDALRDLLIIVDSAAEQQLATLPHILHLTPTSETPALVMVWKHQHDTDSTPQLLARNPHILHPLFVPPDKPVELLQ